MASKNSATLSLPKSRTVRGYEIRKMPIGAFLEACSLLEELPGTALRLLFPEKKEGDILAELAGLDKDKLQELFLRALAGARERLSFCDPPDAWRKPRGRAAAGPPGWG